MKEPQIVEKAETLLVGLSFYGDPFTASGAWTEENAIGLLWQRFVAFLESQGDRIKNVTRRDATAEVHIYGESAMEVGEWEIFVGVEAEKLEDVPVELVVKVLPACTYAIFTLEGEEIAGDWSNQIYGEWMPSAGYDLAHRYALQYYDQRFKGVDNLEGSVLDVWIPVKVLEG